MKANFYRGAELKTGLSILCAFVSIVTGSAGCGSDDDGQTKSGSGGHKNAAGVSGGGKGGTAAAGSGPESGSKAIGGKGDSSGTAGAERGDSGASGTAGSGGNVGKSLKDGKCKAKLAGIYAIKIDVDVYWMPLPDLLLVSTTDSGRGRLRVYLKAIIDSVGGDGKFQAKIHPCGIELPNLLSTLLCDYYKPEISDSNWDSVDPDTIRGTISSFDPGGVLDIPLTSYLYGIALDDPGATWPTAFETGTLSCPSGTGSDCFPDYDKDGKKGVTVHFGDIGERGGGACGTGAWEYSAAPLGLDPAALAGGAARAEELYAGARFRASAGGTIGDDCASGWSKVQVDNFDLRVLSCKVQEGTIDTLGDPAGPDQPCDATQAQFIDSHLPVYIPLKEGETRPPSVDLLNVDLLNLLNVDDAPSDGSISYFVRLADPGEKVTCDLVRKAAFPKP